MSGEPVQVKKKAIDCIPRLHGIWCSIEGGKPFVNEIACRQWMADGRISFMLESFNFLIASQEEKLEVVELPQPSYPPIEKLMAEDDAFRKAAPMTDSEFERSWAQ